MAKSRRLPSLVGLWSLRPDFVEWGVLGVTRLHYTIATGQVTPLIDRTYPLDEAADALRYVGAGHTRGKVVVTL